MRKQPRDKDIVARMTVHQGAHGEIFSLEPTGRSRFVDIPFLGLSVAFWVVWGSGAVSVLGMFLARAVAKAFGTTLDVLPFFSGAFAQIIFFFLCAGFTVWVVAGTNQGKLFLRMLAGRDVISVTPDGLELDRRAGPLRRRLTIANADIRRVRINAQGDGLVADTAAGTVELTTWGKREDRARILDSLKSRLVLPDEAQAKRLDAETPPAEWRVEMAGMETRLALSAARATWWRSEWIVAPGRMTWRRRVGPWRRERSFENATLDVERQADFDGELEFTLRVRTATADGWIASEYHDSASVQRLADWLSARTHFPINPRDLPSLQPRAWRY